MIVKNEKGNANATKDDNDINHNVSDYTTAIANNQINNNNKKENNGVNDQMITIVHFAFMNDIIMQE